MNSEKLSREDLLAQMTEMQRQMEALQRQLNAAFDFQEHIVEEGNARKGRARLAQLERADEALRCASTSGWPRAGIG
jgi:hypothetical protein